MCSRATCRACGKPTWTGCGSHIDQALQGVAKSARCTCDRNAKRASPVGGFFSRLLGSK